MSLQTRITALATAIGADVKALMSGKAAVNHGHAIADVSGLQAALDAAGGGGGGGTTIHVGPTPPLNPVDNQLWIQTL